MFLSMGSVVMGFAKTHDDTTVDDADTLIYLTPKQLEDGVTKVAAAILKNKYSNKIKRKQSQSDENIKLLKYQMLLSALGMNLGGNPNNGVNLSNTNDYNLIMSRLDNIEDICYMLLQERGISLPSKKISRRGVVGERNTHVVISADKGKGVQNKKKEDSSVMSNDSVAARLDKRLDDVMDMLNRLNVSDNTENKLDDNLTEPDLDNSSPVEIVEPDTTFEIGQIVSDTITIDNFVVDGYKRQVFFVLGGDILTKEAKSTLDSVADMMNKYDDMSLDIVGYSSPEGSASLNLKLSGKRADVVYKYLVGKGVDSDRLFVQNGGIDTSTTIKAVSRRVDIVIHK